MKMIIHLFPLLLITKSQLTLPLTLYINNDIMSSQISLFTFYLEISNGSYSQNVSFVLDLTASYNTEVTTDACVNSPCFYRDKGTVFNVSFEGTRMDDSLLSYEYAVVSLTYFGQVDIRTLLIKKTVCGDELLTEANIELCPLFSRISLGPTYSDQNLEKSLLHALASQKLISKPIFSL